MGAVFDPESPLRQRCWKGSLFYSELPSAATECQLFLLTRDGQRVEAFHSLIGKQIGPDEAHQLKLLAHFLTVSPTAHQTKDCSGWTKIGEVHYKDASGSSILHADVFRTPDAQLGLHANGRYYRTDGKPLTELVNFLAPAS